MSVYPPEGKKLGAYMNNGAYDVHPYLLLNHNGDYQSLSTLAHEWGHAVHYAACDARAALSRSRTTRPSSPSPPRSAMRCCSTTTWSRTPATAQEKLYYLGAGVESIRQTFFRQVQFAEFELAIHEELEQGKPLSGERMTAMYCSVLRKYYGEAEGVMKIDPEYCIEWAVVPHFYYNFYVYQYATSMAGAAELTDADPEGGRPGARPVHQAAERRRFRLSLRALQARRHRHGNARAVSRAGRAHEPPDGRNRDARGAEIARIHLAPQTARR